MAVSPFSIPNIRLFIAFRVFFNARFYYPVFTIIFLDFGLTIEQFALLNSVWAATIVLAEVPSGALADVLGRKKLIIITSVLMFTELALLCFVPLGMIDLVFGAFLINRVLSGLAEAMASGADEAIAYDSLVEENIEDKWPRVLSIQMRISSIASILTMTVGALIYDPDMMNRLLTFFGNDSILTQQDTMRFPLYCTLFLALLAISTSLMMRETHVDSDNGLVNDNPSLLSSLKMTMEAAKWIIKTPFALAVILFGMCFDHVVRMVVTMTSQYFRLIDLPEASFGLIGAAIGLLGLIAPKVAEKMAEIFSPAKNMMIIAAITVIGFIGLTFFIPYFGILPMALVFVAIMFTSFFSSHYLNRIAPSHQRATILSFKGLAFNIGYGTIGVLFAVLIQQIRTSTIAQSPEFSTKLVEDIAFKQAMGWFPGYTLVFLTCITLWCLYLLRGLQVHKKAG